MNFGPKITRWLVPVFALLIGVLALAETAWGETTYYCYGSTHYHKGDCGEGCEVYFAIFDKTDTWVKESHGARNTWVELVWDVDPDTGYKLKCSCGDNQDYDKVVLDDVTVYQATLAVRRKGSAAAYSSSATVAAGKRASDVHKADVQASATPAVSGIPLDVDKKQGEGQGQPGTAGQASLDMDSSTTDANGKITGTYTSSNKSETVTLELRCHTCGKLLDTATIHHNWDDDAGLEFNVPEYFIPGLADTCKFTCRLEEGVPIDGHTINWYTTEITLSWYWWNIDTGDDDSGEQEYDHPFTGDNSLPFAKAIGDFVVYSRGSENPAGVYAKTHTVYDYFDIVEIEGELVWQEALVIKYDFGVYDAGVYIAN
jgi:hypothetical protein